MEKNGNRLLDKRENKKYIIILLMITILSLTYGIKYISKSKYEELPEVKLKEIINKDKSFAIMIQENTENDTYKEYTSEDNKWPGDDYKFKEAKCIDSKGDEVKEAVTYKEGKITLTTNKTIYCTIYFDKSIIGKLREKDTQKYLSSDKQGGMYRYQASFEDSDSSEMTNWICFGTKENCGTNDDNIDKYMYRIIGITEEGQMYLLKETFLKEGETNKFAWNTKYNISDCLGDKCEWPKSDLYMRLNGETSNGNPIFVDSSEYEYMAKNGDWYNLIEDHNWMYGDTKEYGTANAYNGDYMYGIETGETATKRYWPDEGTQTTCSSDNPCTEKDYTWSKSIPAKIGLMYMHDVDYAYTGGNPGSNTNVKNSWIHFQKDGYNTSPNYEWLTTRFGVNNTSSPYVLARDVSNNGYLNSNSLNFAYGARPVFYLSSKAKIADGDGTKNSPFIIN